MGKGGAVRGDHAVMNKIYWRDCESLALIPAQAGIQLL